MNASVGVLKSNPLFIIFIIFFKGQLTVDPRTLASRVSCHGLDTPNLAPSLFYPCPSEVTVTPNHENRNNTQGCTGLMGIFLFPSPTSTAQVSSDSTNGLHGPLLGYPTKFPDLTCSLSHQQALPTPPLPLTYTLSSNPTELAVIPQHQSRTQSVSSSPCYCLCPEWRSALPLPPTPAPAAKFLSWASKLLSDLPLISVSDNLLGPQGPALTLALPKALPEPPSGYDFSLLKKACCAEPGAHTRQLRAPFLSSQHLTLLLLRDRSLSSWNLWLSG